MAGILVTTSLSFVSPSTKARTTSDESCSDEEFATKRSKWWDATFPYLVGKTYQFMTIPTTKQDAATNNGFPSSSTGSYTGFRRSADTENGDDDTDTEDSTFSSASSTTTNLLNWSGTHSLQVPNDRYWEPETFEEVEQIVAYCHAHGLPIRPMGSALSPNGLAFCDEANSSGRSNVGGGGIVSLTNLDSIIEVDRKNQTVSVQAGARVSQVVEALRPYNLTLPNLASIAEQQMGGFIQVGAHGTGRTIAPVDHYVTKLKMVTPGLGTITLTRKNHGVLFELAKVGLGCLGVVLEVTMECIPAHDLVEHTFCLSRQQAMDQVNTLLHEHKHVRFMWIPYTDTVVVVTNDPTNELPTAVARGQGRRKIQSSSEEERFQPLRQLLVELRKKAANCKDNQNDTDDPTATTMESLEGMGFADLRDAVLAYNPLDVEHVKRCNLAEAEFWKRSEGYQTKPSDELLQFDCGGQQWVLEVCFPTGTQEQGNGNDMKFMAELLEGIEQEEIPAHSPIEQRWTASSSSLMSPAYGPSGGLYSWVGIINYLPLAVTDEDERRRSEITNHFKGPYCDLMRSLCSRYNGYSHWAKLEFPANVWQLVDLKLSLEQRFPVKQFNQARAMLDPKNLMANTLINSVLGIPTQTTTPQQQSLYEQKES